MNSSSFLNSSNSLPGLNAPEQATNAQSAVMPRLISVLVVSDS